MSAMLVRWGLESQAVVERPDDSEARRGLLEGAMHAGAALRAGMGPGLLAEAW